MKHRIQLLYRPVVSFSFFMCSVVYFFFLKLIINLSGCDKENCKRDIGKDTLSVSKATKCVFYDFKYLELC